MPRRRHLRHDGHGRASIADIVVDDSATIGRYVRYNATARPQNATPPVFMDLALLNASNYFVGSGSPSTWWWRLEVLERKRRWSLQGQLAVDDIRTTSGCLMTIDLVGPFARRLVRTRIPGAPTVEVRRAEAAACHAVLADSCLSSCTVRMHCVVGSTIDTSPVPAARGKIRKCVGTGF